MDLGLTDKIAVITGSSRGLGLASARSLAAEGCLVCLCGRTASTLENARRDVADRAGGDDRVIGVAADLSTPEGVKAVIDGAVAAFGGIDILVNNVGLARGAGDHRHQRRRSGRRRSIRRFSRRFAPRASRCRT